jgi:hypothetical protein
MEEEFGHKMEINMKESIQMIRKMVTDILFGQVGINIKEHFLKILCMDKDV